MVIKKRLGNSPDRGDAYVNGLYGQQFVEGQLIGGRVSYDDDPYEALYWGQGTAWGM